MSCLWLTVLKKPSSGGRYSRVAQSHCTPCHHMARAWWSMGTAEQDQLVPTPRPSSPWPC